MRLITWKRCWAFLVDSFSVLGLFGAIITVTGFFDQLSAANNALKSSLSLALMLLAAIVWGILKNRPRSKFEYKMAGKDVRMRLIIGDIFSQAGAIVVPINDEFDAFLGGSVLKTSSIKAEVIKRYFEGDSSKLSEKLRRQLVKEEYETSKNGAAYKMGTTVMVEYGRSKFYFTANSRKVNKTRVASRNDDLTPTLAGLWSHLANYGAKGEVAIPLLGTGNGRLPMTREDVFKEIVRSFVASCSEKSYCEMLSIVIRPIDVQQCEIDIEMLNEFLMLNCKYATFASDISSRAVGTAVN